MIAFNEPVAKLVWIVRRVYYRKYRGVVNAWDKCFQSKFSVLFPTMEFRDPQGNLIAAT